MASLSRTIVSQLSAGLRSGTAFVAAMAAVGAIAEFTQAPPIFTALIASLVAAGMAVALAAHDPFDTDYTSLNQITEHVASCLAAIVGLWGAASLVPAIGIFVCEPLVPWQSNDRDLWRLRHAAWYPNDHRRPLSKPGPMARLCRRHCRGKRGRFATSNPMALRSRIPGGD